ncbi:hypothetical protein C8R44DRAFT_728763 [Mycena epipterygia]|nr:hypothetical protein C8R44DRAFT_728763 [Mycena epipterygia]
MCAIRPLGFKNVTCHPRCTDTQFNIAAARLIPVLLTGRRIDSHFNLMLQQKPKRSLERNQKTHPPITQQSSGHGHLSAYAFPTTDAFSPGGAHQFSPNTITAPNGTPVTFWFAESSSNHSVIESSFAAPCTPLARGAGSDHQPIGVNDSYIGEWGITINNDQRHPSGFSANKIPPRRTVISVGMVAVINVQSGPSGANTFAAFQSAMEAAGNAKSSSAPSSAPSSTPSSTAQISGVTAQTSSADPGSFPKQSLIPPAVLSTVTKKMQVSVISGPVSGSLLLLGMPCLRTHPSSTHPTFAAESLALCRPTRVLVFLTSISRRSAGCKHAQSR